MSHISLESVACHVTERRAAILSSRDLFSGWCLTESHCVGPDPTRRGNVGLTASATGDEREASMSHGGFALCIYQI